MASRYWVGGSGTWNTTTTNWAATSGGAGGQTAPGVGDDVFFDLHSNESTDAAYTVTLGATVNCLSLDISFTGTTKVNFVTGAYLCNVYGNLNISGGTAQVTNTPTLTFKATSTGKTVTTNGVSCGILSFNGAGGGWTLQDNLTTTTLSLVNGTLDINDKDVSISSFAANTAGTRTLYMGNGTWFLNNKTGALWDVASTTIFCESSTIKYPTTLTANVIFNGSSYTYNNLWIQATGVYKCNITGSNTFNDLKIDPGSRVGFAKSTTQTVSTLNMTGTSGSKIMLTSDFGGAVVAVTVINGGSGYSLVGARKDLYITGGLDLCKLTIATVSSGAVATVSVSAGSAGSGYVAGTTYNTTNSAGTGCTIRVDTIDTTTWTISDSTGINSVSYCDIWYSVASGGASFQAYTSNGNTDGGTNTGWIFAGPPAQAGFLFQMI